MRTERSKTADRSILGYPLSTEQSVTVSLPLQYSLEHRTVEGMVAAGSVSQQRTGKQSQLLVRNWGGHCQDPCRAWSSSVTGFSLLSVESGSKECRTMCTPVISTGEVWLKELFFLGLGLAAFFELVSCCSGRVWCFYWLDAPPLYWMIYYPSFL